MDLDILKYWLAWQGFNFWQLAITLAGTWLITRYYSEKNRHRN